MIDVFIVGAGPTGLLMALECAQRNLSCRIIDKGSVPNQYSKALAIQSHTLEMFEDLGIVQPFLDEGLKIEILTPMSQGNALATFDFTTLDTKYPFILSLEQSRTEALLQDYLAKFSVSIERGVELVSFQQTEESVIAMLLHQSTGELEKVICSFLLGCDGAHSTVRKQMGLTFTGEKIPHTFSLADVEISWQYPHNRALIFLDPEGLVATFPLPGEKRYRVIALSEENLDCKGIETLLRQRSKLDVQVSALQWQSHFQVHTRIVDRYRVGRAFVLGDAAHIHSPIGGQGMNTGLQDAHNLAGKLAQVIQGKANFSLLDLYSQERRGVGLTLLSATKRATSIATCRSSFLCVFRNLCFRTLMKFAPLRQRLMLAISQLSKQSQEKL